MIRGRKWVFILFFVPFYSCSNKDMGAEEYINFFRDKRNGFVVNQIQDSISYKASILSKEYMALINLGDKYFELNQNALDSAIQMVDDISFIMLEWHDLRNKAVGSPSKFNDISKLLENNISQQISLFSNGKEYPCIISNPQMGLDNGTKTIWLGFTANLSELSKPIVLKIKSNIISRLDLDIEFKKFSKNSIPRLIAS